MDRVWEQAVAVEEGASSGLEECSGTCAPRGQIQDQVQNTQAGRSWSLQHPFAWPSAHRFRWTALHGVYKHSRKCSKLHRPPGPWAIRDDRAGLARLGQAMRGAVSSGG